MLPTDFRVKFWSTLRHKQPNTT